MPHAKLGLSSIVLALALAPLASAQTAPTLPNPSTFLPGAQKGTVNMSVQTGSRASLSFGTNTTFTSSLLPAPGGTIKSTIGDGAVGGITTAKISNLKASGNGPAPFNGSTITTTDGLFSSGDAVLDGVKASIDLGLKETDTFFKAATTPISSGNKLFCGQFGTSCSEPTDPNSSGLGNGGSGACDATANPTGCGSNQVSSASANAQVSSNTNVDIQSSNFTSTFVQGF
jgi:hypothetical protein